MKQPVSATTVRTVHQILSQALGDAVRGGLLLRKPAANVPLPMKVSRSCRCCCCSSPARPAAACSLSARPRPPVVGETVARGEHMDLVY